MQMSDMCNFYESIISGSWNLRVPNGKIDNIHYL
jgi:hypothetical protein